MKKVCSFILVIVIIFTMTSPALAADVESTQNEISLASAVARIKGEIPDAEVRVVDNVIHIVVDDLSEVPWFDNTARVNATRSTSVTSSSGGSFRNFDIPWYGYMSFAPYSQVYMNKDVVDGLKLKMLEPTFCRWVVDQLGQGLTTAAVAALAYSVWGISVSSGVITVIGSFIYWAAIHLEYWSLKSAQDNSVSGKVSVVHGTTPEGYVTYIYSAWNNNTCTTYGGYDATWYGGVYDV